MLKLFSIIAGVLEIIFLSLLLVIVPNLISSYVHIQSVNITQLIDQVYPLRTQAVALLLAIASGATTILSGNKYRGYARMLQGIAMSIYFYLVLNSGAISISIILPNVALQVGAFVALQLMILEVASFAKIAQAGLEIAGK